MCIVQLIETPEKSLAPGDFGIRLGPIRAGFLSPEDRAGLIAWRGMARRRIGWRGRTLSYQTSIEIQFNRNGM